MRPQPYFDIIKKSHRHFFHKRDRLGHLCSSLFAGVSPSRRHFPNLRRQTRYEIIENPNRAFKDMEANGISMVDVVGHMHFVSAWTYATLLNDVDEVGKAPLDPGGYFLKIIDCRAIGLGDCGGATATYFKLINAINRNYPERVWRTIILNAPSIFGVIWSIVSPLLEPNVREKITVLRGNYEDTLRELVAPENLPVAYGGTDAGASPEEEAMRAFVMAHRQEPEAAEPADDASAAGSDASDVSLNDEAFLKDSKLPARL